MIPDQRDYRPAGKIQNEKCIDESGKMGGDFQLQPGQGDQGRENLLHNIFCAAQNQRIAADFRKCVYMRKQFCPDKIQEDKR